MNHPYTFIWLFERNHICPYRPLRSTGGNSSMELLNVLEDERFRANQVHAAGLYMIGPDGQFISPNLLP